jgi:ABC-type glycerol-3-phosphate transport system permease component
VAVLHAPLPSLIALLLVVAVIALVAWALQLMQAANDRQEFSLMLAGCMVCSAAVGLATVMVITLTGPEWGALGALNRPLDTADSAGTDLPLSLPASFELPWDGQL